MSSQLKWEHLCKWMMYTSFENRMDDIMGPFSGFIKFSMNTSNCHHLVQELSMDTTQRTHAAV